MASYIYAIQGVDGQEMVGFDQVRHALTDYYINMIGKKVEQRDQVDFRLIQQGPFLTQEHQIQLTAPFLENDIKAALFSIPNIKSPGPDGFSSGFYKAC